MRQNSDVSVQTLLQKCQQAFTRSSLTVSELNRKPVNQSVRSWPEMFKAAAGCKLKVDVMQ